ncbi:MAG: hypothetical protein HY816_23175 [Candidatus Wallbacteria bacterium]|nr:hypothetical protein [Candidatus Wallbacteria bacterium]
MVRKMITLAAIAVAILAAAAGLGVYKLKQMVEDGQLVRQAADKLRQSIGRGFTFGQVSVVGPLTIEMASFKLDPGPPGAPELSLDRVRVSVSLDALFSGKLELDALILENPSIRLTRGRDQLVETGVPASARMAGGPSTQPQELPLSRLRITGGKLVLADAPPGIRPDIEVSGLAADVTLPRAGAAASFDVKCSAFGGSAAVSGSADATGKLLGVSGRASSIDLGALSKLAAVPLPVSVKKLPVEVRFELASGGSPADAKIAATFQDGEVALPGGVAISGLEGAIQVSGDTLKLEKLQGSLFGGIPFNASGQVTELQGARRLALELDVPDADLAQLAEASAGKVPSGSRGRVRGHVKLGGTAAAPVIEGELVPKEVVWMLDAAGVAVPVAIRAGSLKVTPVRAATERLALDVGGQPVEVAAAVEDYASARKWTARLRAASADVAALLALAPPAVREAAAPYSPKGKVSVTADARGAGAAFAVKGELVPEGVSARLPVAGASLAAQIASGKIRFSEESVVSENLAVEVSGTPAEVAFKVTRLLSGNPDVSASARVRALPVEKAVATLPPEQRAKLEPYNLSGSVAFDVGLERKSGKAELSGSLDATGLRGSVDQGGRRVDFELEKGRILPEGDLLTTDGLIVSFGVSGASDTRGASRGRLAIEGGIAPLATPPRIDAKVRGDRIELASLAALMPQMPAQFDGTASFSGEVRGTLTAPSFEGRATLPSVSIVTPGSRGRATRVALERVSARVTALPGSFQVSPFEAVFYGGKATGTVSGTTGAPIACKAEVAGADFGALMADLRNMPGAFTGRVDAGGELSLAAGAGISGLSGQGAARIGQLVVNGRELGKFVPGFSTVKKAQKIGKLGALAGGLVGKHTILGRLGAQANAATEKYAPMLEFAMQEHAFGVVRYDYKIDAGRMSGPVASEGGASRIDGQLDVDLAQGLAVGQFQVLVSDGAHRLEIANAQLDTSKQVPVSTANGFDDVKYHGPQASPAAEADPAAEAPATQEPSQPTAEERLIGGLKGLFGGKKKKGKAPPAPEPAPAAAAGSALPAAAEPVAQPAAPAQESPAADPTAQPSTPAPAVPAAEPAAPSEPVPATAEPAPEEPSPAPEKASPAQPEEVPAAQGAPPQPAESQAPAIEPSAPSGAPAAQTDSPEPVAPPEPSSPPAASKDGAPPEPAPSPSPATEAQPAAPTAPAEAAPPPAPASESLPAAPALPQEAAPAPAEPSQPAAVPVTPPAEAPPPQPAP